VDQLDLIGQQLVDAVADDRVGLPPQTSMIAQGG
jgi:hypothetical protein